MANLSIQMNILNESDSYDVLHPESDYNLLLNKPSIPDISGLNGLKMEKGSRVGTGKIELNAGAISLCDLSRITHPLLFYYNHHYASGISWSNALSHIESNKEVTGYFNYLTEKSIPLGIFTGTYYDSTQYIYSSDNYYDIENTPTLVKILFTPSDKNFSVVGYEKKGSHTYTTSFFNIKDKIYYWWCLGY